MSTIIKEVGRNNEISLCFEIPAKIVPSFWFSYLDIADPVNKGEIYKGLSFSTLGDIYHALESLVQVYKSFALL